MEGFQSEERVEPIAYAGHAVRRFSRWRHGVTGRADRWIRRTTIGCAGMLALIAGTVSYLHMHLLVELHGSRDG